MGYMMGLRSQAGIIGVLEASCLVIFFAWCTSWIFAFFGVIAKTASGVQGISMMILFPLTFLSNAFVLVNTLPRPEFRLVTNDIEVVYKKVASTHPEFLHPNLNKVTLRPWGAKEFALKDDSNVCMIIQQ